MGDVIHALPAVASLRASFPDARISWVVDPKWAPLLAAPGFVDRIVSFDRRRTPWLEARAGLRRESYDVAIDLQGLIKSALVARAASPQQLIGYASNIVREKPAAWFYSTRIASKSTHVVDMGLDLARAVGARIVAKQFPLPQGKPEGALPAGPFALACPLAGWTSKQWPLEHYRTVAVLLREKFGMPLVLNGAPGSVPELEGALRHESGIEGLINATRRAAFVIGVDSGPLHLAAALNKSGVAIYGPTDPARNGPCGGDFTVLRVPGVETTHKRGTIIHPAMRAIEPAQVFAALTARSPQPHVS